MGRLWTGQKLRGALSDQVLERVEFSFEMLCKSSDLADRRIALSQLIRTRIPHEGSKVRLNVLQSNGHDQSKVVEVIEKTLWLCHSNPGNHLSERALNVITGIFGICY
jgi:hypothetical protein